MRCPTDLNTILGTTQWSGVDQIAAPVNPDRRYTEGAGKMPEAGVVGDEHRCLEQYLDEFGQRGLAGDRRNSAGGGVFGPCQDLFGDAHLVLIADNDDLRPILENQLGGQCGE